MWFQLYCVKLFAKYCAEGSPVPVIKFEHTCIWLVHQEPHAANVRRKGMPNPDRKTDIKLIVYTTIFHITIQWRFCSALTIVGTHSTLFRNTPYIPWEFWLAKSHFHKYARGRGDKSSSKELACYDNILFNLIQGFSY